MDLDMDYGVQPALKLIRVLEKLANGLRNGTMAGPVSVTWDKKSKLRVRHASLDSSPSGVTSAFKEHNATAIEDAPIRWENKTHSVHNASLAGLEIMIFGQSNEFLDPLPGWSIVIHGYEWTCRRSLSGGTEDEAKCIAEQFARQMAAMQPQRS